MRLSDKELTALKKSEDVIDAAIDAASSREIARTARLALEISPLCADAYVFLAIHGDLGRLEKLQLWRSGVAAAEIVLGENFDGYRGEFWGFLETRPYMRARHGLAMALCDLGQFREAGAHLAQMLELNPNDNQGVRYVLMELYVAQNQDKAARALIAQYPDEAHAWFSWSLALLGFRTSGDSADSKAALAMALDGNRYVPAYLTGKRKVPKRLPNHYQRGERDEAVLYATRALAAWSKTDGALDWLTANLGSRK